MKQITPEQIPGNLFERIGKQWFLLTAGTPAHYNTMTCSWGMAGVLWNKPSVTCYVRQSRHTLEYMEGQDTFTLSFFPESKRPALSFCGTHSGRACDKPAEAGLVPQPIGEGVTFADAELVLVCRKRFASDINPAQLPAEIRSSYYSKDAAHRMYIGEITAAYIAE